MLDPLRIMDKTFNTQERERQKSNWKEVMTVSRHDFVNTFVEILINYTQCTLAMQVMSF